MRRCAKLCITATTALSTLAVQSLDHGAKCDPSRTLDPSWAARWDPSGSKRPPGGDPGFHKTKINWIVQKYGHLLTGRVLVPLCGKTLDMPHLATKQDVVEVVGVEGVSQALSEFKEEQQSFQWRSLGKSGSFSREQATTLGGVITFLLGDFFALEDTTGFGFDAVWDRGGLVAVDPALRGEYRDTVGRTLKPGGVMLLCGMDRRRGTEAALAAGPPFSLSEADARELFGAADWVENVELLDERDLMPTEGKRWKSMGLDSIHEVVLLIRKKTA